MTFEVWLAFVAASAILLLIPGPTVLMVVGDALANRSWRNRAPSAPVPGWKPVVGWLGCSAWATVAGVVMADATAMTLSLAGAGALLEASATAFTFMKTLGGLYLIYLGAKSILSARRGAAQTNVLRPAQGQPGWRALAGPTRSPS